MDELKEVPGLLKPENNLFGVEETIDGVKFFVASGVAVDASFKDDGKITAGDLKNVLIPVSKLPQFITGIDKIPAELKDVITDEEMAQIVEAVRDEFPDGTTEEMVVDAVKLVIQSKNFYFKHFVNN